MSILQHGRKFQVKEAVRERKGNLRFFPLPYTPQGLGYTGPGDPKITETWPWESTLLSHLSQLSHLLHHPLQVPVLGLPGSWGHIIALGVLKLACGGTMQGSALLRAGIKGI